MLSQGLTVRYLAVEVQNVGRFPVAVRSVMAKSKADIGFSQLASALNPADDHRIEPFAFSTWFV